MDVLRSTMVEAAFRPANEEPRSLLDFVDEQGVETMRDALKDSIRESKVYNPNNVDYLFLTCFRRHKQNSTPLFSPSMMTSVLSKLP
jgi:hypothetical protein